MQPLAYEPRQEGFTRPTQVAAQTPLSQKSEHFKRNQQ